MDIDKYEIIVVTDGPDNITTDKINKWMPARAVNLQCISLPQKQGPAAARNMGWRMASGELIAFTDDDCVPDPSWLKNMAENFNGEEYLAFKGRLIVPISKKPTDHELNTYNLERASFITANCAVTKKALERVGGFDERFTAAWREDSDLEFKLLIENMPIIEIRSAIVVHPVRKAPWGYSIREQKKGMFNALLYKKFPDLYRQKIRGGPPFLYYAMVISFILMVAGIVTLNGDLAITSCLVWMAMVTWFTVKRLSATTRSFTHVAEMAFTSMIIPFLSVYWHWYGVFKFKTVFI